MRIDRREEILRLLETERAVHAGTLAARFGVSGETVRRDLEGLEREGLLRRVHGGAVPNTGFSVEPDFDRRESKNDAEKRAIGRRAAELVEDGDTVFIDVGTTTLELARALRGGPAVTVITGSLLIALTLKDEERARVILLGGQVRGGEGTTSGHWAEEMADGFQADKLFLGVGALTAGEGVMDYHIAETNLRRHCIRHARQVIALADYSKLGIKALNVICPAGRLDVLVTDPKADPRQLRALREQGVEILTAHPAPADRLR